MFLCALLGIVNGLLITRMRIISFIVTLGAVFDNSRAEHHLDRRQEVSYFGDDILFDALGGHDFLGSGTPDMGLRIDGRSLVASQANKLWQLVQVGR